MHENFNSKLFFSNLPSTFLDYDMHCHAPFQHVLSIMLLDHVRNNINSRFIVKVKDVLLEFVIQPVFERLSKVCNRYNFTYDTA